MILRITEPGVFQHPVLAGWLSKVCTHFSLPTYAPAYIPEICARANTLVLLGLEAESLHAILVIEPPSPLTLYPIITLGYNSGSAMLGRALVDEAAAWCRQRGITHCHGINGSGKSDAAYERLARSWGWQVANRQAFMTFAVPPGEQDGPAVDTRTRLGLPAT